MNVPSQLAWLDSSRAEQQRMRELISMFSDQESRDDLGIGQVRDAFGDLLFPGMSTLHTRARYLLLVPWCLRHIAQRRHRNETAALDRLERRVIAVLKDAGETDGLIGSRALAEVKTLPSTIYASALRRYGIDRGQAAAVTADEASEELTYRMAGRWPATLPEPEPGFPDQLSGLALLADEAGWLREWLMVSVPGTLLEHLLKPGKRPERTSSAPWEEPAASTGAPARVAADLEHARRFSVCMHGAALLYNLLVAEAYVAAGHAETGPEEYRERLDRWAEETGTLGGWDLPDMWSQVIATRPQIAANRGARRFVEAWIGSVLEGRAGGAADDTAMRDLVGSREKAMKTAQSRLLNDKRLAAWNGASGTGRLLFRWPQTRRMLIDIHDGLESADAAAA